MLASSTAISPYINPLQSYNEIFSIVTRVTQPNQYTVYKSSWNYEYRFIFGKAMETEKASK